MPLLPDVLNQVWSCSTSWKRRLDSTQFRLAGGEALNPKVLRVQSVLGLVGFRGSSWQQKLYTLNPAVCKGSRGLETFHDVPPPPPPPSWGIEGCRSVRV